MRVLISVLTTILASQIGCHSRPPAASSRPTAVMTPTTLPYSVSYGGRATNFSNDAFSRLLGEAIGIAGRSDVWHVRVASWYWHEDELMWDGAIYFYPDVSTPQIRHGRVFYVRGLSLWFLRERRLFRELTDEELPERPLPEYVQVAWDDAPFGKDAPLLDGSLTPFARPPDFTDEELVEIVRFVRTNPRMPEIEGSELGRWGEFDGSAQIVSIKRRPDGTIEVMTGEQRGSLNGNGQILRCKKQDGKWIVVEVGMWVS